MSTRATIDEQADEVGREVRQRERLYPRWISEGRIKSDTAARKIATMRDAEASLRFIKQHAAGLRALVHFLLSAPAGQTPEPTEDEKAALLAHPAVKAVLEVWPDAEVSVLATRPLEAPVGDLFDEEREGADA